MLIRVHNILTLAFFYFSILTLTLNWYVFNMLQINISCTQKKIASNWLLSAALSAQKSKSAAESNKFAAIFSCVWVIFNMISTLIVCNRCYDFISLYCTGNQDFAILFMSIQNANRWDSFWSNFNASLISLFAALYRSTVVPVLSVSNGYFNDATR